MDSEGLQKKPVNLLFFFSTTVVGGAETNILKISRELKMIGYNIFWCYLVDDGMLLNNVDFHITAKIETGLFYKEPFKFYKIFKKFIRSNQIDVVFNFGLRVEIISRLLSKKMGVKKIISNIRSTDDWRKWYHVFLDRLTQHSVDIWVSNSIAGKSAFSQRELIPDHKIKVIYNFFESPATSYQIKDLKTLKSINIGILANITREKGYFDLIAICNTLRDTETNFKFIYAGVDKTNGEFEKAIYDNQLQDKFEYLGYISDKKIFFEKIDIFILPSYLEGMPTAILEAMAYSKPVISTTVGGIPEIIANNINGYLCPPGDIECFVKAIKNFHNNAPLLLQESEKVLNKFSKDVIIKQWVDIITGNNN